jgi:hypothetical protein
MTRYVAAEPTEQRREPPPGPGIAALSLGAAAPRLRMGSDELEAIIAAGKIEALPTGFTRMNPD